MPTNLVGPRGRLVHPAPLRQCTRCPKRYEAGTYSRHARSHGVTAYTSSYAQKLGLAAKREPKRPVLARRRISAKKVAILTAWQSGRTGVDVATEFGVSREYVRQVAKEAGYSTIRHPRPGESCPKCGGTFTGSFRAHARAANHGLMRMTTRTGPTAKTRAMAAAYVAGGDAKKIAAEFGVSSETVYRSAAILYGATRYHQPKRIHPRTAQGLQAVEMLRNGEPVWRIVEETGLPRRSVDQLWERRIRPRETLTDGVQ